MRMRACELLGLGFLWLLVGFLNRSRFAMHGAIAPFQQRHCRWRRAAHGDMALSRRCRRCRRLPRGKRGAPLEHASELVLRPPVLFFEREVVAHDCRLEADRLAQNREAPPTPRPSHRRGRARADEVLRSQWCTPGRGAGRWSALVAATAAAPRAASAREAPTARTAGRPRARRSGTRRSAARRRARAARASARPTARAPTDSARTETCSPR